MKSRNCPTCGTKLSAGTETILDAAMSQHTKREHPPEENPADFSHSGLGIGGLGSYQEPPFIPTLTQMERMERLEAEATTCRRCGQDDVFGGAMFTTDASSGLCDDCY